MAKISKRDFCFTYYDGDATRDMAHMNRLERGCYTDIIIAIRNFGHLTMAQIKKVLSKDFDECWSALELILKTDDNNKYFIGWLENSTSESKTHSEIQKEKADARWDNNKKNSSKNTKKSMPRHPSGITEGMPLEDEDEDVKKKEEVQEKKKTEPLGMEVVTEAARKSYDDVRWRDGICMGNGIKINQLTKWMAQFNSSVSNDYIHNFDDKVYRKMLQGWMQKKMANGHRVSDDLLPEKLSAPPLKTVQNV